MAIVKEFYDGNTRILFDDSEYKDKTPEEIRKAWEEVCEVVYEIQVEEELRAQGLLTKC